MLSLPIWFVTDRKREASAGSRPCSDLGPVVAFSTTEKLAAFLAERQLGQWEINLVSDRAELILIIAIAHNHGMESICIDPQIDGSDGGRTAK